MTMRLGAFILLAAFAAFSVISPARADGGWLDRPLVNWNRPGMAIPAAPAPDPFVDPRCGRFARPVETAEDAAVAAAGWTLFGMYEGGWGVKVLSGLSGYDGMCRPFAYQTFVFVDGVFAGTISPDVMSSRTDGAAVTTMLQPDGEMITAEFVRYTDDDPLCCPSRRSTVIYRIDGRGRSPVLTPISVSTSTTQ
jgi:hypothetical protein